MFIQSRNVWHPKGRASAKPSLQPEPLDRDDPTPDADALPEPSEFHEEPEPDAWGEADELAVMSDEDFYRQLRQDVTGVRQGSVPSITDAMRPPIQNRPWSPRRKRRDRYGRAF